MGSVRREEGDVRRGVFDRMERGARGRGMRYAEQESFALHPATDGSE